MRMSLNGFIWKIRTNKLLLGAIAKSKIYLVILFWSLLWFIQAGCQTPSQHILKADNSAMAIISEKQKLAFGDAREFTIERPSDLLRRRLLIEQHLPYTGEASLGTDKLKAIEHWPEKDYPKVKAASSSPSLSPSPSPSSSFSPLRSPPEDPSSPTDQPISAGHPLQISLIHALQIGAGNSFEYQTKKEDIFRAALDLDLWRDEFRHTFTGQVKSLISTDARGERTVSGTEQSAGISLARKLKRGAQLTTALAVDLANLLTLGGASSLGIQADASITVPLLRGSGKHIVTEPLTQAERNVVYAMYEFESFKKTLAVEIATEYLAVLRQLDQVKNTEENYRSLIASARRSRRLADAGRLTEVQVDQAVQDELRARHRWITAIEDYKSLLDSFKSLLGLPPDAEIELDRNELEKIELEQPGLEKAGPLEIDASLAIELGLNNRLDLRVSLGRVYDAKRAVVVAADALGMDLNLLGTATLGERRSIASANLKDARVRTDKGLFSALLTLDLPLERTAERNAYRESFILLERAVRDLQILEDQIKLSIRSKLRDLRQSRHSLQIQAKSVYVARKRVKSINLFLEAGRAQIRDLLEAQDALLSAQNGLTAAAVNYRTSELELQRDMGVLQVDEKGLWKEYSPGEINNAKDK